MQQVPTSESLPRIVVGPGAADDLLRDRLGALGFHRKCLEEFRIHDHRWLRCISGDDAPGLGKADIFRAHEHGETSGVHPRAPRRPQHRSLRQQRHWFEGQNLGGRVVTIQGIEQPLVQADGDDQRRET